MNNFARTLVIVVVLSVVLLLAIGVWFRWNSATPDVYRSRDIIVLDGAVNSETIAMVRRARGDDVRGLRISSRRASEPATIELAELVEQEGWEVHVAGDCFDGCALYILSAATKVVVEERGLVACGPNVVAGSLVGAEAYQSAPTAFDADLAQRARSLYRRRGISESFAFNCLARVLPVCYTTYTSESGVERRGVLTGRRYWIPLGADLTAFGFGEVAGVPTSAREVQEGFGLRWRLGGDSTSVGEPLAEDFLRRELPRLARPCDRPRHDAVAVPLSE